jgi:hypothetical protein
MRLNTMHLCIYLYFWYLSVQITIILRSLRRYKLGTVIQLYKSIVAIRGVRFAKDQICVLRLRQILYHQERKFFRRRNNNVTGN